MSTQTFLHKRTQMDNTYICLTAAHVPEYS